jgi:anti-anti-sigma factor
MPSLEGHGLVMDTAVGTSATLEVVSGVCVVTVTGALDAAALHPLRTTIDAALTSHPKRIVLDLRGTTAPEGCTVALLSAARRYLCRRGVALTLTATPPGLSRTLCEAHVDALYDMRPSIASAVADVREVGVLR